MIWLHLLFLCFRSCLTAPTTNTFVYPTLLEERGTNGQKLLQIHEGLTLELEKTSILAEDFHVTEYEGEQERHTMLDGKTLEQNLYHDTQRRSVVTVSQNGGSIEVEGILSHNLRIRPSVATARSDDGRIAHVMFEVEKPEPHDIGVPAQQILEERVYNRYTHIFGRGTATTTRKPTILPPTVTVEIHLLVCEQFYFRFNSTSKMMQYLSTLAYSAVLRYSTMKNPGISFKLVGLSRPKDGKVMSKVGKQIDARGSLNKMINYVDQVHKKSHMDLVVLVTVQDLDECIGTKCGSPSLAGMAFIGGMCTNQKMIVMEDDGAVYSGDQTMAHEIAHGLGAAHDGDGPVTYIPGNRGAQHCPWKLGYLMSYEDGGLLHYRPSPCTVQQIVVFLKQRPQDCIDVKSNSSLFSKTARLPGHSLNATTFCQRRRSDIKGVFYHKDENQRRNCKITCCRPFVNYKTTCFSYSMPNGMECGLKKTCLNGVCGSQHASRGGSS